MTPRRSDCLAACVRPRVRIKNHRQSSRRKSKRVINDRENEAPALGRPVARRCRVHSSHPCSSAPGQPRRPAPSGRSHGAEGASERGRPPCFSCCEPREATLGRHSMAASASSSHSPEGGVGGVGAGAQSSGWRPDGSAGLVDRPEHWLRWKFGQCFGDRDATESFSEADVLSAVEFDPTGEYLATGDKGGRVVVFKRAACDEDETAVRPPRRAMPGCCVAHPCAAGVQLSRTPPKEYWRPKARRAAGTLVGPWLGCPGAAIDRAAMRGRIDASWSCAQCAVVARS